MKAVLDFSHILLIFYMLQTRYVALNKALLSCTSLAYGIIREKKIVLISLALLREYKTKERLSWKSQRGRIKT
jgi:hypothetical protein